MAELGEILLDPINVDERLCTSGADDLSAEDGQREETSHDPTRSDTEKLAVGHSADHNDFESPPYERQDAEFATQSAKLLIDEAQAVLAAALSSDSPAPSGIPGELGQPAVFEWQKFGNREEAGDRAAQLDTLNDVELDLRIELGRSELSIEEADRLREGAVVPLDTLAGDPVDILVNGRLVARGEVLVLNDNFCVRVAEVLRPDS